MTQGQVLLFRAGGLRLGVFLAEVGRLLVEGALLAVPFAHPAMAGLLVAGEDGPVPVFDLTGLIEGSVVPSPPRKATVALFPTARGPVGLRLEELLGTVASYEALDAEATGALHAEIPPPLLATITGAARGGGADDEEFSFFSPEAFLAGLGL
jgi:hypothetical protein